MLIRDTVYPSANAAFVEFPITCGTRSINSGAWKYLAYILETYTRTMIFRDDGTLCMVGETLQSPNLETHGMS